MESKSASPDLERAREMAAKLWLNLGTDPVYAIAKWSLEQRAEEAERGVCDYECEGIICEEKKERGADLRRQAGEVGR